MQNGNGILDGIRVIDCGTYIAGPAAATIMSDFGAEVIKIEHPPEGDLFRNFPSLPGTPKADLNYCWILTGRNRKSVALELQKERAREILLRLVKTADVFVTNFQVPLLKRFNLTWDDLSAINERLVYAHITGYGNEGNEAEAPAFDALAYWARSGLMTGVTGPDGRPSGPRPGIGDHPTASALFGAIMVGLYRRERTGRGSKVGTSLMAAGAWANACDIQAKLCGGYFPERPPADKPVNPLIGGYMTRDLKVFMLTLLDADREYPRLCEAIGTPELATNPMFATAAARVEYAAELYAILRSQFESRDLAEWQGLFRKYDVKWSTIPTLDEVVKDPQMRASRAFVDLKLPNGRTIDTINSPVFVEGAQKRQPEFAPEIGAHTREVLRGLGYDDDVIAAMLKAGVAAAAD